MPPSVVEAITLGTKPVEQTTEFVGTIKSRRSTDIQPQVEGFITRIAVKSGDRVRAGAVLMDIDSRTQQASIASLDTVRAQREIDVIYARQEADRAKKLLDAGAGSQMEADRAANALKAADAQLRTAEEQIRQQKTELGYYQVTAPNAGVVGDIPVRVGDRATKSTLLTTIDANEGLELYVNVPVQQAAQLRVGLPIRIVDDKGETIETERISFVSPTVDTSTQTVLVKLPVSEPRASGTTRTQFRADQFVRARVVWSTEPALLVPVTAVTRINGQFFVFVAERPSPAAAQSGTSGSSAGQPAPPSGLVARQRAVALGNVIGNEYVVSSGLAAGEQLIVSGIQKIGDGAPVSIAQPANGSTGTH
jgi:RND family efflux transporter MFP subunit